MAGRRVLAAVTAGHGGKYRVFPLTRICKRPYKYAWGAGMGAGKTFRQGQILRLVTGERIGNQEELRRRLAAEKMRVTQATLSRDLQELRLVKTQEGYKQASALTE